jgi:hypothetical protein
MSTTIVTLSNGAAYSIAEDTPTGTVHNGQPVRSYGIYTAGMVRVATMTSHIDGAGDTWWTIGTGTDRVEAIAAWRAVRMYAQSRAGQGAADVLEVTSVHTIPAPTITTATRDAWSDDPDRTTRRGDTSWSRY